MVPITAQFGDDVIQHPEEIRHIFGGDRVADDGVPDGEGHFGQFMLESLSFSGQGDDHLTGILLAFLTDQQTFLFHPLEQGSDRIRLQEKTPGDIIHRLGVLLPQDQQDQILRISQPVLREQRVIGLCEKARSA